MSELLSELVEIGQLLVDDRIARGTGGNLSVRDGDTMWISPDGLPFVDLEPEDYIEVSITSGEIKGDVPPSYEVMMHLVVYRRRPEIEAVFHTHPPCTVALSLTGHDLLPLSADYCAWLGATVPHIPYVIPTSQELADAVDAVVQEDDASVIVLRRHGILAMGETIRDAYYRTLAVEEQANLQHAALQIGDPVYFTEEERDLLSQVFTDEFREQIRERMQLNQD